MIQKFVFCYKPVFDKILLTHLNNRHKIRKPMQAAITSPMHAH